MKKKSFFYILKIIFSLAFIFFILYYFFGKNSDSLQEHLKDRVKIEFVILSMIFGGLAYVSRGLRWVALVDAINYNTSKKNAIAAVSIGYFTNLFLPRAGEISRCTSLYKTDNIPVEKLFGTILIERVIDFIFLVLFALIAFLLKSDEIFKAYSSYKEINTSSSNFLEILIFTIVVTSFFIFLFRKKIKSSKFYHRVKAFLIGIKEGFYSIKKIKHKSIFWIHTISIWVMYFLMTWICFFTIPETINLNISDGIFLLVIGGIGMVIPSPGGIGSYHLLVMIGLFALQIDSAKISLEPYNQYNPAMLFPFIVHTAQTFVAIIMGIGGLFVILRNKISK